jgi:hypothetical protein
MRGSNQRRPLRVVEKVLSPDQVRGRLCTFSTRRVRRMSGLGFPDQAPSALDPRRVIHAPLKQGVFQHPAVDYA